MMTLITILQYLAVIITLFTGLYSLIRPRAIKGFTGIEATSPRATTEIRAVMGGTFLALGLAALLMPTREVFLTLGIVYAVIASLRAISMVVDKSVVQSNIISLVTELVLVVILVLK